MNNNRKLSKLRGIIREEVRMFLEDDDSDDWNVFQIRIHHKDYREEFGDVDPKKMAKEYLPVFKKLVHGFFETDTYAQSWSKEEHYGGDNWDVEINGKRIIYTFTVKGGRKVEQQMHGYMSQTLGREGMDISNYFTIYMKRR